MAQSISKLDQTENIPMVVVADSNYFNEVYTYIHTCIYVYIYSCKKKTFKNVK